MALEMQEIGALVAQQSQFVQDVMQAMERVIVGQKSLLERLLVGADVFTTNLRPGARERLGIEVEQVRQANPHLVYARGSAFGPEGPDAGRGGYDAGA